MKNPRTPLFVASLLTFVIPFFPVFVLLTDHGNLELGAILFFAMAIQNIPVGVIVGLIAYAILARKEKKRLTVRSRIALFVFIALIPITTLAIVDYSASARYKKSVQDFAVSATLTSEAVTQKTYSNGEKYFVYDYTLSLTNMSSQTFRDVNVGSTLKIDRSGVFSHADGHHLTLTPGMNTLSGEIQFFGSENIQIPVGNAVLLQVTATNKETGVSKDFDLPSTNINWAQIFTKVSQAQVDVSAPAGLKRFRNVERGVQLDYPQDWTHSYGAETGAPPAQEWLATNNFFSKAHVGMILIQWDQYMLNQTLCFDDKPEENIVVLMRNYPEFAKNYAQMQKKNIKIRVCIEDVGQTPAIQQTLATLRSI